MLTENYEEHWVPKFLEHDYPLTEALLRVLERRLISHYGALYQGFQDESRSLGNLLG